MASSITLADQTYTLKLKVTPGEKWDFDVTSGMKLKGGVTSNGQLAQPIDQALEQHRKGTIEILTTNEGLPTSMRIVYSPDCSNTGTMAGQPVPEFALAGKTVTLHRGGKGDVINDLDTKVDPQTLEEVNKMMEPDTSMYPKNAVSMNQEWDADTATIVKAFQLNADDKVTVKCKLNKVEDIDGRQVADVSVSGQIIKHDQGFVETTTDLDGMSKMDLATGQTVQADLIGKMTSRGRQQVNGADGNPATIVVNADGQLTVHQVVKLPRTNGLPANGLDPLPAPTPVPAPGPAPAAMASGFAGSFKGDQLELTLTGDNDQYAGTLSISGKKLPVTAKADGNKLKGIFESDGSKFDFTATLDGSTITLNSDGNTYTMKKPSTNPLARPAPRNPLGQ